MNLVDDPPATWRRSSYSTNGGNCVETGEGIASVVPVRDSKDHTGPALLFQADRWDGFVSSIKQGTLPG